MYFIFYYCCVWREYIYTYTIKIKYIIVSANKLKIRGYMFRPHCSHLQANLHRSSAFNVCTIWDPIVCTIMICVIQTVVQKRVSMDKISYNLIALKFWYKGKRRTVIIQAHKQSTRWWVRWWYNSYNIVYRKWTYIYLQKITLAEEQFRYSVTQCTERYYSLFLNYPEFYLPMDTFFPYILCG